VSREVKADDTVIDVGGVLLGGAAIVVMAARARWSRASSSWRRPTPSRRPGPAFLRGGAFKPRTSPTSSRGWRAGLKPARRGARSDRPQGGHRGDGPGRPAHVPGVRGRAAAGGAPTMQNFSLLKKLGSVKKPVLLKRGPSATIREWLMAGRGTWWPMATTRWPCASAASAPSRPATRNTLDLNAVPVLKALTHLPVVVTRRTASASGPRAGHGARRHRRRGRRHHRGGPPQAGSRRSATGSSRSRRRSSRS